jgi:hypothetical protein
MARATSTTLSKQEGFVMSAGKKILLFILIMVNTIGWINLLIQWCLITQPSNQDHAVSQDYFGPVSKDLPTDTQLIILPLSFDPQSNTFSFIYKFFAIPEYLKGLSFGNLYITNPLGLYIIDFPRLTGYITGTNILTIADSQCLFVSNCILDTKRPTPVPFIFSSVGWYPFERYYGIIGASVILDNAKVALPVGIDFGGNSFFNATRLISSVKHIGTYMSITLSQPAESQFLFVMVTLIFIFFTIAAYTIKNLSDFLQVSIAILIGLWGLKDLLSPSDIPAAIRYGSEQVILYEYLFLGVSMLFWLFDKWATSKSWRLFKDLHKTEQTEQVNQSKSHS